MGPENHLANQTAASDATPEPPRPAWRSTQPRLRRFINKEETMFRSILPAAAGVCLMLSAAQAETVRFHATLTGAAEVPPKTTTGTGTAQATLDTVTKKLDYTATWKDLSGPATAAHFHGPADVGANAGVVVPWGASPASPLTGSATLTDAQIADLTAGKWYANVHTAANPGGEIRGQMTK
jgi:hypothetical protein